MLLYQSTSPQGILVYWALFSITITYECRNLEGKGLTKLTVNINLAQEIRGKVRSSPKLHIFKVITEINKKLIHK